MASNPLRILIAEDEKPIANALKLKLSHYGYEVEIAENGAIALELVKKNKYDLILLDLIMPMMDGFEVLVSMKEAGISIPVIVSSNLGQPEDIQKAKSLGASQFLVKSDTPLADIVNLVNNVLGKD